MRYDTKVELVYITPGAYDDRTGNYADDKELVVPVYASVSNTGAERIQLLYGELKQGVKTFSVQNHIKKIPDKVRINGRSYKIDHIQAERVKQIFTCSEAAK